ncbi:MAG: DSD1 family PLP-dependent enzyme [Deltaproteobacteria bacterium]|nr:DSD1 family PLP-dependent enzyme [Deltaproteobacteria bacterium]MBW2154010.1 DSD1 family PLP-dependent enzyme [Deltaproteobacteria bacterium]
MQLHTPPAQIGIPLEMVDTPALLIDLDAFERNLKKMAEAVRQMGVRLRPHAKTHKCPVIALKQMAAGAVGVCCQKVGEAEAMVYGGVCDVHITNEIVGKSKIERLIALAKQATIAVCADDPIHLSAYAAAAQANNINLAVFVEVNVGTPRCGLDPGEPVLKLAKQIQKTPGLCFAGLQAYHGRAQHKRTPEQRKEAIRYTVDCVRRTKAVLEANGIKCRTVTGAGTGTYRLEGTSKVFDELQAGSYIFMDVDYAKNLKEDGQPLNEFEHSLFVYSTIMSRPTRDRAVLDAGHKAVSIDSGMPLIYGMEDVQYTRASDEHGTLKLNDPQRDLKIGDKLKLIPGHCDPTVNLFDWYVGIRNNRVECLWPITARGAFR